MQRPTIEELMQQGKWGEAVSACREALMAQPTSAKVNGYLGLCYFRAGEFAAAIEPLERATVLDPHFVDAAVKLAQCYDRLGKYGQAYTVASEWLAKKPSDRTLQGLCNALGSYADLNRTDGWERSRRADNLELTITHGQEAAYVLKPEEEEKKREEEEGIPNLLKKPQEGYAY